MAAPKELDEVLSAVGPAALDRPCSDDHLVELAVKLTDWKEVAYFLRLNDAEIEEVEAGVRADLVKARSLRMLRKWRAKYGRQATYRCLCTTLWKLRKRNIIEEVIQLLQAEALSLSDPSFPKAFESDQYAVYADYLKVRYDSDMPGCTLEMVEFPQPPTNVYFDLCLIERGEEGLPVDKELASLAAEGRVREVMEKRTPVKLEDLFSLDRRRRKVILIEGPPGSGKTTLSWHICRRWRDADVFPGFRLVVYVQLRDPVIQSAQSIADLLPCRNDQMAREVFADMEAKDGEGVLFVLDGWDELPGRLPWDSPLRQLVESSVRYPLQCSAVIITSRSEESAKLHSLASSRVQIVGFSPEKVEDYITTCLKGDPESAKALVERIKENPAIEGCCSLPLNVAIVVTLFLHMGHQLPATLSGIFEALVLYCILRHIKARMDISVRSLSSLDALPEELQKPFDALCVLAFQGVLSNQIFFVEREVCAIPDFAGLSLLQAVESFVAVGSEKMYSFLHLSDMQSDIMHNLRVSERFEGVFRFYAGFTHLNMPWNKEFLKLIIRPNQYEVYEDFINVILECLHEVQDPSLYQFIGEEFRRHKIDHVYQLSPVASLSLGYLLALVAPINIDLDVLDEQCAVLLTKGLNKGWDDQQRPRGGLSIDICVSVSTPSGVEALVQLLTMVGVQWISLGLCVYPPLSWQQLLKDFVKELTCHCSVESLNLSTFGIQHLLSVSPSEKEYESAHTDWCEMLTSNRTLKTLMLSLRTVPVHVDIPDIAKGLVHNSTLKHLQLTGCGVKDEGVKSLAAVLTKNTTLEKLDLSGNEITDVGVWYLADVLTENVAPLKNVDLSWNSIRGVTCLSLVELLKHNTSLMSLNLSRNYISPEALNQLVNALKYNRTLKFFYFDIHPEVLESLATALTVNTTVSLRKYWNCRPWPGLAEKLMANGVLKKLLTIAIEKTVRVYGEELTSVALFAVVEEWKAHLF